jgi:hypothetical protein
VTPHSLQDRQHRCLPNPYLLGYFPGGMSLLTTSTLPVVMIWYRTPRVALTCDRIDLAANSRARDLAGPDVAEDNERVLQLTLTTWISNHGLSRRGRSRHGHQPGYCRHTGEANAHSVTHLFPCSP